MYIVYGYLFDSLLSILFHIKPGELLDQMIILYFVFNFRETVILFSTAPTTVDISTNNAC